MTGGNKRSYIKMLKDLLKAAGLFLSKYDLSAFNKNLSLNQEVNFYFSYNTLQNQSYYGKFLL